MEFVLTARPVSPVIRGTGFFCQFDMTARIPGFLEIEYLVAENEENVCPLRVQKGYWLLMRSCDGLL